MLPFDFGHLVEGTLEQDPLTGRFQIQTTDRNDNPVVVRLDDILAKLAGQEVRFTIASLDGLARLAEMVSKAGLQDQVVGLHAEDLAKLLD
jgi:hypothetical protein